MGRILIPFSGGYDSFVLGKMALDAGHDVDFINASKSLNIDVNKANAEIAAAKRICDYLISRYPNTNITYTAIEGGYRTNESPQFDFTTETAFSQAPHWFFIAAMAVRDRHDEIWMGYHTGDQFVYHLQEYENAWNTVMSFTRRKWPVMKFPLLYYRKPDILLKLTFEEFTMAWTCELPLITGSLVDRFWMCGECPACNTVSSAIAGSEFAHRFKLHRAHLSRQFWQPPSRLQMKDNSNV